MSAQPNREVALFSAALELPASERAAYLNEACADDPALRRRLEELLRVHQAAITFLENKAPGAQESPIGVDVPDATIRLSTSPAEKAGDRIGRYKLLQQIGEGGCGAVYMAEQEEPVRRRVALKVIKLGMDTKQVIARFEAERQALALMDHPNIAKVLDAGATETGRPFFVMELVRGIKITDYCDEHSLSTEERLKLFIQVSQAVQHAHQKGIIHRDIKPSNILVTVSEPGAGGCPKVIDFGIAKATTGQHLTDKTVFTAFEQFIGTPAYMSPEQATMTSLDIDTRTDIYSLGVLLYELLTGKTPLDQKELLAAGLEEMRRTIREKEPIRPSTRLSTMLKNELTTTAKHRRTEPPKLIHAVRGDLDWIVMKCLEKDRARRYETANGLARDLQRHLNCEPVTARPPSRLYEFHKTVRRHKFGFAAAAAVGAALVLGMVGSALEAARAKRAERDQIRLRQQAEASQSKSQTETAKATAVSDFLQQMLRSANPDDAKGSGYTVRQLLDDYSAGLGNQFENQPDVEASLRAAIGNAYYRLGVGDKAEPHLERALAVRRHLYGDQSEEVAQSLVDHAWSISGGPRRPEAEAEARQALDIYRRRGSNAQAVIHALWSLGVFLNWQGKSAEVESVSEQALVLVRNSPERDFPDLANILHNLAQAKLGQGKYLEAQNLAQQAVEMHRRLQQAEHPETAWSLWTLGRALAGQHKLVEAERSLQEALAIFRRYYSFQHITLRRTVAELERVLEAKRDSAALEGLYREVLAGQRSAAGSDSLAVAEASSSLAAALYAQGKRAEAEKVSREAIEILLKADDQGRAELPPGVRRLAEVLKSQGKSQDAEGLFETAINLTHQKLGETNLVLGQLLREYADFLQHEQQKLAAAEQAYREALAIFAVPRDIVMTLASLARVLQAQHKTAEARTLAEKAVAICLRYPEQVDSGVQGQAFEALGGDTSLYPTGVLTFGGDVAAAVRPMREALTALRKSVEADPKRSDPCIKIGHLEWRLGDALVAIGRLNEAEQALREALQVFGNAATAFPREPFLLQERGWSAWKLAILLQGAGRLDEAEAEYRHAVALHEKASADFPEQAVFTERLFTLELRLVELLRNEGKHAETETLEREAADHGNVAIQNEIAWRLATDPDPKNRNGFNAVVYAERAVATISRTNHSYLDTLAAAYAEAGQFTNAVRVQQEANALLQNEDEKTNHAARLKLYAAATPYRDDGVLATRTMALLAAGKFVEAEPLGRDCLALREKQIPNDWRAFNARSMLGGALLGQKKYGKETEALLLAGYQGMKQREAKIPPAGKPRLEETRQRLVQLYEAAGHPDQAAEWKQKQAQSDRTAKQP
jgi:serine/threonine protein kinase